MIKFKETKESGISFIDVIVGTSLFLIIFIGIFGAFQLGLKVISQSKNKISATAIANEQMEKIKNLPYQSIGIKNAILPFVDGVLDSSTTTSLNGIEYLINTTVKYISDTADGFGIDDNCDLDYKRIEIIVSWSGKFNGEVKFVTDISPKNIAEELNSCTIQPGGVLSISIFDAFGQMVESSLIEVFNSETELLIDSYSSIDGKHNFPLATSSYKVVASKGGEYTTERTYGINEIATPEKPNPLILEGQVTEISLSIDNVSLFSVDTFSPWGRDIFFDSFNDVSKISESSDILISEGEVNLATDTQGYIFSGYLISTIISPSNILNWEELSFTDFEVINTDLNYQIYYASGTEWYPIPEEDLNGNELGFDVSPVDLSFLSISNYPDLKIKGNLSSNSTGTTPSLEDWQLSWITNEATPISNVEFNIRGGKIIGTDEEEVPVYKYDETISTNSSGHIDISDLEWDLYTFSINPLENLDLVEIYPDPQPINLNPNSNVDVSLYLKAENSLLLTIQNISTLEPVFSASSTLSNLGLEYEINQSTDLEGQTYYIPLSQATYNIEVEASGYLSTSTIVYVTGDITKTIKLQQVE
ncbi:MAG: hypothetical protein ABID67_01510 [Candidatus Nealsonbacteria bacterium]